MHASNPSSPSRHSRCGRVLIVSVLLAALCSSAWAQRKSNSDLTPPARRATTVELATRLAATSEIPRLPAKSVNPFSPAGWDAPDPDEQRLASEAAENARRAGLATPGLADHLWADVLARVAIDQPTYPSFVREAARHRTRP